MATLPAWSGFTGSALNADELSNALWSSDAPGDSFDILNGGLNKSGNWPVSVVDVPMWAVQPGAMVAGCYHGFDRRDMVLAAQGTTSAPDYIIAADNFGYGLIGSMSYSVFLPFECEAVLFSFQAWCKQVSVWYTGADATEDGDDTPERFVITPYLNGTPYRGLIHTLPPYTHSEDDPGEDILYDAGTPSDPALKWEHRWRCISGSGFVVDSTDTTTATAPTDKGRFTIDFYVYGNVQSPDPLEGKVYIDSGGVSLVAIR